LPPGYSPAPVPGGPPKPGATTGYSPIGVQPGFNPGAWPPGANPPYAAYPFAN